MLLSGYFGEARGSRFPLDIVPLKMLCRELLLFEDSNFAVEAGHRSNH